MRPKAYGLQSLGIAPGLKKVWVKREKYTKPKWHGNCLTLVMEHEVTCCLPQPSTILTETEPPPQGECIQEDAFARAYDRGFLTTLRFLCSLGASKDMAEEVAQAAWTRGWQYRAQLVNPLLAGAWVNTIARNLYWNCISMQRRFEELEDYPVATSIVTYLEASDMMNSCSETESRMLTMFYLEGYTTMEIAEKEGLCPTTVRVRLMRIRRSLRDRVTPRIPETPLAKAA